MMKYIVGGILLNSVVACVPLDTEPYDRETDLSFGKRGFCFICIKRMLSYLV